jgi:hypothetical protein
MSRLMSGPNDQSIRWFRVFAVSDDEPQPASIVEQLRRFDPEARGDFRGDAQGWFAAKLHLRRQAIAVERYLPQEEDLRGELNTWAAWIEASGHAESARLMQQIISSRQLFTLQLASPALAEPAQALCCWLASQTAGVVQIDGAGWLTAGGELLIPER